MGYEFDKIITKSVGDESIDYGIVLGNENIVFMKVGADQDIQKRRGNLKIYVETAKRAHELCGATVICASNPDVSHEDIDESVIRKHVTDRGYNEFRLYLWGISDGAYKNLFLAKRFSETVKFIGLNTSFITVADFIEKLQVLRGIKKFLVYGTEDDEFVSVFPVLQDKQEDHLKTIFVLGADHCFRDFPLMIIDSVNLIVNDDAFSSLENIV